MSYHHNDHDSSRVLHPEVDDFQLLGDSQFVRFAEQILHQKRWSINGVNHVGLCVSGQRICDLSRRVEECFYPTSKRAVLMIGTNDLLKNTPANKMRRDLEALVLKLIERGVRYLVLLTIPPVPRLAREYDHWSRLKEYNDHIKSLHNGEDVFVVDAYSKFVKNFSSRRGSCSSSPARSNSISPVYRKHNVSSKSSSSHSSSPVYSDSSPRSRNRSGGKCMPLFANLELSPVDCFPNKRELRVSLKECGERDVYVLRHGCDMNLSNSNVSRNSSDFNRSGRDFNRSSQDLNRSGHDLSRSSRDSSFESCRSSFSSVGPPKRSRPLTPGQRSDSPPLKRRLLNQSIPDDDHDDRFCAEDSSFSQTVGIADDIDLDLFEEYFSRKDNRKDLIHLNYRGLRVIDELISKEIKRIRRSPQH